MRVVFFSGSGLSAGSGVPTFRGRGGLYSGMRPEEVLSADTLAGRPDMVHGFLDDFRQLLSDKQPNAAHRLIADWKRRRPDTTDVVTMNIDGLLEAAGCPGVEHLHGVLSAMRSIGNRTVLADIGGARYWSGAAGAEPRATVSHKGSAWEVSGYRFRCPVTGSGFRPHVVLFGESVREEYRPYYRALRRLGPEDALVVVGTQGNVVPVCHDARHLPCLKVLCNLDPSDPRFIDESKWDKVLRKPAEDAADDIARLLEDWEAQNAPVSRSPGRRTGAF